MAGASRRSAPCGPTRARFTVPSWGQEERARANRWRRCECGTCGDVHRPPHQISGFRPVPLLDPAARGGVVDPGTGEKILIFDALRSIDPVAYGIYGHPFSSSTVKVEGGRARSVGRFQREIPDPSRPGVRCPCPHCGHLHIRRSP